MKQCKLFIAILLAMLCLLACAAADKPTVYTSGDYKYILLEDGTAEIAQYTGKEEMLTVPDELDGYRVTGIGDRAFYSCTVPKSITLPDSVTSIGNYAFSFCDSLTSITLPDSVTSIGNYAFSSCRALTSITLPDSLTSIGDWAFCNCTSLTSITLPDNVTSIGNYAFTYCRVLTSITLPDSLTSIGTDAFTDCPGHLTFTVPMDSYAEQWCIDNNMNYTFPDANDWLLN